MSVETGFQGALCVGDATASMTRLDVLSENVRASYTWVDGNGVKGTRSRNAAVTEIAEIPCGGNITIHPRAGALTYLMPKITGDTSPVAGLHKLQETLPDMYVIKKESQLATNRIYTHTGFMISRAVFSATRGQPVTLSLDGISKSEAVSSSYPSDSQIETTNKMFMFQNLSLSLGGTTYEVFDYTFTIDHMLQARQINSRFTTQIYPTDRIVTVRMTIPYGDVTLSASGGLITGPFADTTFAHVATFTNAAGDTLVFTCPALRMSHPTPVLTRGEIMYEVTAQAFKTGTTAGTTDECSITCTDV